MKQIRLFLILVFFAQYGFGQDCTIEKTLSADASICNGQPTTITLFTSENGVYYQLRNNADNSSIGVAILGDGNDISFTVSPTSSITYNVLAYTNAPCAEQMDDLVSITVDNTPFVSLTSGNNNQTVCVNTAISNINHAFGNASSVSVVGLPAGVSGNTVGSDFIISGVPSVFGTFNYTITATGICSPDATATGTITVTPAMNLSLTTSNNNQTVCVNTSINNIVFNVSDASNASVLGLPTGVSGNYASGVFTISGTPTVSGVYNYTVSTSGGCNPVAQLSGTITVTPAMTISLTSGVGSNIQTRCINTAISTITYALGNASGASVVGLPAGVSGSYASGVFTISGTPTVSGVYNYTVATSGGCNPVAQLSGTITVTPAMTISLTSGVGSNIQTRCINTAISTITYALGNASGASVVGLPAGVSGSYASGVFTISGTPTVSGVYNYSVSSSGGCNPVAQLSGTITVTPNMAISSLDDDAQVICINSAITPIHYTISNATGATVTGLPTGVSAVYSGGIITISGTSLISGTFNFTVTAVGGCGSASAGSSITIQPLAVGGVLADSSGFNPATVCYSSPAGTLNLSGQTGNVVSWERSTDGGTTWSTIPSTANLTSYSYAGLTITTLFRVNISNGALCPIAKSSIVLVNVIPNIKPSPVTATPPIICNGGSSLLAATSGYATSQNIASGGTFQNSNPTGWLVDGCGNCLSAGASNTNPGPFQLSATNGGTYSGINYAATGKFAIANGNFDSILQTPVFSTFGLASATLQFNHAFNLLAGAWVKVELSTDGGANYNVLLLQYNGASTRTPYNNFPLESINLNNYIGQPNLRVRFNYHGVGASSWAVDNIQIPQTPVNITTQWVDGSGNVVAVGTNYSVSPTVTTTYGVRSSFVINGSATCTSSGSLGTSYVTVTVNPRPTAVIGPSQTVCNSTPATFSVALTGTAPWVITYNDGITSTTVTTSANPYIFNTPNLTTNKVYRITALQDANCTSIAADFTGTANVNVLNGTPGLWTGFSSADWFDCLNWAGGGTNPPSITTNVVIPSGVTNMPNINAASPKAIPYAGIANAGDLLISGSASLTMSNASSLNIGKDWKNSGVFNAGNGTVIFAGSTLNQVQLINQSIKNNEQFYNLTLNNSGGAKGIILPNAFQLTVANNLTLQSGDLRLTDEAQLVQNGTAANPLSGSGRLFRDQQGKKSSYHYTYWSSPVSSDNVNYTLAGLMKDGTDVVTNPFATTNMVFGDGLDFADGPTTNPIKISNRWLCKYASSANAYANWQKIDKNTPMKIGEGFTMKGCDGTVTPSAQQNFVFAGKPNNGDITVNLGANESYLVGNPYPSALDADKFIRDNIKDGGTATTNKFNGVLYFWDHFGGYTHYLAGYIGGYATYSLMGGVVAVSNDPLTANTGATGSKVPKRYVPVAQGFFINSFTDNALTTNNPNLTSPITGGAINFKNSQRAFMTESSGNSVMMRTASKDASVEAIDVRKKIRIQFISSIGINRQLLIGADENASDYFDLGYDAPMIDAQKEDMFWNMNNAKFVIQAVKDFNANRVIPLGVIIDATGENTFKIKEIENFDDQAKVYLFDAVTNQYYDLRESEAKIALEKGEYFNRFSIQFEKNTLSTNPETWQNDFVVYFSKNEAALNILNNAGIAVKDVQIFNLLGQKVFFKDLNFNTSVANKLPVVSLAKATYVVKIATEKGIVTKKIIRE